MAANTSWSLLTMGMSCCMPRSCKGRVLALLPPAPEADDPPAAICFGTKRLLLLLSLGGLARRGTCGSVYWKVGWVSGWDR